jgi:hypothetical protein
MTFDTKCELTVDEIDQVSGGFLGVAIAVVLAIDAILITDAAIRTHCLGTLNEGLHR